MAGTSLPSADVRVLIMFIALFLLIFYFFVRAPRPIPLLVSVGSVAMLVMLGMNVLLAGAIVWDIRPNRSLLQLDANRVAEIDVESTTVSDHAKVDKIVEALHESHMFIPRTRKWGKPAQFRIVLTSGEICDYRIVRDLETRAVLIKFLPKYGIEWGYAYSPRLDSALDRASATLPE